MLVSSIVAIYVKYFFLLTPFFILAVFLSVTEKVKDNIRSTLAIRLTINIVVISLTVLFFGQALFSILGITVDAYRIGTGALLFLFSVSLVNGTFKLSDQTDSVLSLCVVPLAFPVTIGPGSVAILIIWSTEIDSFSTGLSTSIGVTLASITLGIVLLFSNKIKEVIGNRGIMVLSKITGVILAALSCQMMFSGAAAFFK